MFRNAFISGLLYFFGEGLEERFHKICFLLFLRFLYCGFGRWVLVGGGFDDMQCFFYYFFYHFNVKCDLCALF